MDRKSPRSADSLVQEGEETPRWAHAQEELDAVMELVDMLSGSQGEETEGRTSPGNMGKAIRLDRGQETPIEFAGRSPMQAWEKSGIRVG